MYKALVRSHLDYCDIIYHEPSKINQPPLGITLTALMENVERIQYQAALAVTGTWQGSSRTNLYEELGWESLSDRRRCRRILQVHKIKNGNTPSYLKDKLPIHHRPYPVGNIPMIFRELRSRTVRYANSFFPEAIASWNIFISHFGIMPNFASLRTYISSFFRPKKRSIFDIHDPLGVHYLFQLRVGLSPLRSHKKRHNFIDTPSENCNCNQSVESTSHFLFECPIFATQRVTLAVSVIGILLRNNLNHLSNDLLVYLYGHDSMSDRDNKTLLQSTIKYIKDTQRFST